MKGLDVLKRLLLLCSISLLPLMADDLKEILSKNKTLMFEYDLQRNELESDKLSKSWINPVMLRYTKNYSTQFPGKTIKTGNYAVSIDQPIFRSGGIYNAIKYADAFRHANRTEIILQRRMMIGDAVSILFELKKNALQQQKIRYQIKNDEIDIRQKRESYNAGILESSFLDQAILKKSQDEATLLELQLKLLELKQRFSLLSDKDPKQFKVPHLKLMSKHQYRTENLELKKEIHRADEAKYQANMTIAKYLPAVSLQGQYLAGDLNPLWASSGIKENYYNYGFSVSMPLDVNSFTDIESSKVAKLKAATQVADRKEQVNEEYDWIRNSLSLLDRKIALAKKDEQVYASLYRLTKDLAKAGEKTDQDVQVMRNSMQIRRIDQKIYEIDKQLQLLKLYIRVENVL
ncbi:MAG: TolC family protein [Sulfurovum sp.]|nr:TolC family protein [Sulfurovum sp.]